jgi:hypothetical protein
VNYPNDYAAEIFHRADKLGEPRSSPLNNFTMSKTSFVAALLSLVLFCPLAKATEADDTTINILAQHAGPTPFISQLTLSASDTDVIKSIKFSIKPKTGSITRPLSATYSNNYLLDRGYLNPSTKEIFLPVYGLYDNYSNTVTLTYAFLDGSSKDAVASIATPAFSDPCGYENPVVIEPRTSTALSYDYMIVKGGCNNYSPAIMDTEAHLRWVGTANSSSIVTGFYDNAVYITNVTSLYRMDLDGTLTFLHDYSDVNATYLYHNIDLGKYGIILDADTASYFESVNIEVDATGKVLKIWNLADIISAAMIAGGDDPSQFVYHTPVDWWHNNAVAYNRGDDSLIVSSRQHFLVCLDYSTGAIKWILGDPTKEWYQYPSLRKYALTVTAGGTPPSGQHGVSVTADQDVMVFDNGQNSSNLYNPPGVERTYASPRKYKIDLTNKTATEVWNYEMGQSVFSPFCGSVYEDAPSNYLIDYALVNGFGAPNAYAQLAGVDVAGNRTFYYSYATDGCLEAYNSRPLHLESTSFPTIMPRARNLSTRGYVGQGDNALIGGLIVSGTEAKSIAFRALGPSLGQEGISGALSNPILTLYDSTGKVVAINDDWQSAANSAEIVAAGLAPSSPAESVILQSLNPGAYTVTVTGKNGGAGISLIEAYDLTPATTSRMANLSTRGTVGVGQKQLVSGFIVGDVDSATFLIRGLGPSLSGAGIANPLSDPVLTVFDSNGTPLVTNDNWQDDNNAPDIRARGLAPNNAAEAATIVRLPAGAYTSVVSGANGAQGVGLVEVYDLDQATDPGQNVRRQ